MLTRTVWYTLGVEDGWENRAKVTDPHQSLSVKCWIDWICALAESLHFGGDRTGEDRSGDSTGQSKGLLGAHKHRGGGHSCLYTAAGGAGWSPEVQRCFLTGCFTRKLVALHGCWPRPNPFLDEMDICKLTGHSLRAGHLRQAKTKA